MAAALLSRPRESTTREGEIHLNGTGSHTAGSRTAPVLALPHRGFSVHFFAPARMGKDMDEAPHDSIDKKMPRKGQGPAQSRFLPLLRSALRGTMIRLE